MKPKEHKQLTGTMPSWNLEPQAQGITVNHYGLAITLRSMLKLGVGLQAMMNV